MKVILKDRKFSYNAPTGYIPKDGEVWEAVNADTCTHISCGKYEFTLVDLDEVLEEL